LEQCTAVGIAKPQTSARSPTNRPAREPPIQKDLAPRHRLGRTDTRSLSLKDVRAHAQPMITIDPARRDVPVRACPARRDSRQKTREGQATDEWVS
jgi:hypothetical protein